MRNGCRMQQAQLSPAKTAQQLLPGCAGYGMGTHCSAQCVAPHNRRRRLRDFAYCARRRGTLATAATTIGDYGYTRQSRIQSVTLACSALKGYVWRAKGTLQGTVRGTVADTSSSRTVYCARHSAEA